METPAPIYYTPTDDGPIWPTAWPKTWPSFRPIPYRLTEAAR